MQTPIVWLAEHLDPGADAPSFRIGRAGEELIAEWRGLVRLVVRRDGSNARFLVEPGAYEPNVEKIRSGSAKVLLRHLAGKLSLHGASVGDPAGEAVVLLGRSGEGKSTLAATLCARGLSLFADDAVALERTPAGYDVEPTERLHWLTPEAQTALGLEPPGDWKAPIESVSPSRTRAKVGSIVELASVEGRSCPQLVRVDREIDALSIIVPQVARFVLDEPEAQRTELEALAHLVAMVPHYRLERPRGFEHLAPAAELLHALSLGKVTSS